MASGFVVRSLTAISQAIRGNMRLEMPGTDALVWPNTLAVFGKVVAMAIQLVEQRAEWIYRQVFASTAEVRQLERQAWEFGMSRKQPSPASGLIRTTGAPGTVYPAGIAFISAGTVYRSAGESLASENGDLTILVAAEATGAATNRDAGETLTLADAALHPTIAADAVVDTGGLGGGADLESDDSLRSRVLDRKRRPPQGGAVSDYEQLALDLPGVLKAWAWPFADGPGTVGVWFLFEGRENFIPEPADVAFVDAEIRARRLIRAGLAVSAPIPEALDVTLEGLANDTAEVRSRIEAALRDMLFERARPGVAIEAFVLSRSWVAEAVSGAIGEERHRLVVPADDVTYTGGHYPVLGAVSYV